VGSAIFFLAINEFHKLFGLFLFVKRVEKANIFNKKWEMMKIFGIENGVFHKNKLFAAIKSCFASLFARSKCFEMHFITNQG
jgi:hypothetical protein